MNHPQSISQRLSNLTDNAWAYGIGLGTVSAPVIFYAIGLFGMSGELNDVISRKLNDLNWMAFICGTLGMVLGGRAMYRVQRPRRSIERVLLLAMTTPFVALVIAATPFFVYGGAVFLLAMWFGLMLMPLAIIVTACWSALYFSLPAPNRAPIHALGPEAGDRSTGILVIGSLVLLASVAALVARGRIGLD